MLNASTETNAAARIVSRQPQNRDAKQPPSGFSTLVDENAASKTDSSRPRSARDADFAQRSSSPEKPRDKLKPDDRKPDTDAAPSADDASMPTQGGSSKVDQADEKLVETTATDSKPDADKSASSAADAVIASAALIAPVIDALPIPVAPNAAAISLVAPPTVAAPVPQTVTQTGPAPLAIAAAGIAAAKVASQTAGVKAPDAGSIKAKAASVTDASDQLAIPAPDAPTDQIVSVPTLAVPVKTGAAVATETVALQVEPAVAKPPSSETPPVEAAPANAPAIVPNAPKPAAPATDAKAARASIDTDAGVPGAAPKQPHEQHATLNAQQIIDTPSSVVQPVTPHPASHTAAAASPTAQLTATVATAAPVPLNGLAVELAARAQSGASRFDIRLDPAELGRIDVRIDIDRHGQVTSHLTVEKPETLAMLRQDSPQLQRALNDAGLKTPDGSLQFSLGDQSQPRQNTSGGEQQSQRFVIRDDETIPPTAPVRSYGRMLAAPSGVDISV